MIGPGDFDGIGGHRRSLHFQVQQQYAIAGAENARDGYHRITRDHSWPPGMQRPGGDHRRRDARMAETQFRELASGRWKGPVASGLRGLLGVLEVPYAAAVRWRNWRFDLGSRQPRQVAAPVISVGNLTVGGTGKT